jgi:hypothetical protein
MGILLILGGLGAAVLGAWVFWRRDIRQRKADEQQRQEGVESVERRLSEHDWRPPKDAS